MMRWPVSGSTQLVGGVVEAGALVSVTSAAKAGDPASARQRRQPVKVCMAVRRNRAKEVGFGRMGFTIEGKDVRGERRVSDYWRTEPMIGGKHGWTLTADAHGLYI